MARAIVEELCTGGATPEVGLHADGRRTTLALVEAGVAPDARPRIGAGSVVVASGGARGVTAAGLVALARACRPRIVLLGRTPLADGARRAPRRRRAALKRALATKARARGARSIPRRSPRAWRACSRSARSAPRSTRSRRPGRRRATSRSTCRTPTRSAPRSTTCGASGGRSPRSSTAPASSPTSASSTRPTSSSTASSTPRSTACAPCSRRRRATRWRRSALFSSVAARTGNPGQCDYAMANEVLNQVAAAERARRGAACVVRSIGWGPWEGGMVTPSLEKHFAQMGVPLIPLDAGARMFVDELQGGAGEVRSWSAAPPAAARSAPRRRGPSRSSCASTPRRTPTSRTTGSRGRRWCRW